MFNQVLERMGARNLLHAQLLNTFSLLEYIGTRKIIKSQVDRDLTEEMLAHIAEEIRHAQVLKLLALKLSDRQLTSYNDDHLLCGAEGKAYIQTIDRAAEKALPQKDVWMNYLLTTLLIEERASAVYPIYNSFLSQLGFPNKLIGIIRDEDKHLVAVLNHFKNIEPDLDKKLVQLRELETVAFNQFMGAILARLS